MQTLDLFRTRTFAFVGVSLAAITVLIYYTESRQLPFSTALRYLYLVPIVVAAFSFGLSTGVAASLLATSLFLPILILVIIRQGPASTASVELSITLILFNAIAYVTGRLAGTQSQQKELYRTLNTLGERLSQQLRMQDLLDVILDECRELFGVEGGEIIIYDERLVSPLWIAASPRLPDQSAAWRLAATSAESLPRWLIRNNRAALIYDLEDDPRYQRTAQGGRIESVLAAPLRRGKTPFGVLALFNRRAGFFTAQDQAWLEAIAGKCEVAIENARLYDELAEQERLRRDLEIARNIQVSLLPTRDPQVAGLDLVGFSIPAEEVGGDFYHYIETGDERLGIVVGDVSGKGVAGALFMAVSVSTLRAQAPVFRDPAALLTSLNMVLYPQMSHSRMNAAMLYAIFEPQPQGWLLRASNAGLIAPLIWHTQDCEYLEVRGLPLGALPDALYHEQTIRLVSGDVVTLTSDGVLEAKNEQGEMFGFERFEQVIQSRRAQATAHEIAEQIQSAVQTFIGKMERQDDITIVVVRVN
jgi:sigma-B regulation protein RsbU (phosphoserine phosphatase)